MMKDAGDVYPVWIFRREAGVGDAPVLWFNCFGSSPDRRQRADIRAVLVRLRHDVRAGQIAQAAAVVGWGGNGVRPPHAADTSNPAVMRQWYARACKIVLGDEIAEPDLSEGYFYRRHAARRRRRAL